MKPNEKPDEKLDEKPLARKTVKVVDYDPGWPAQFAALKDKLWPGLSDIALAFEHVGSTSVPGLAAKPVIDLDIVIADRKDLPEVVKRLAACGYTHRGNLGIEDREAFRAPAGHPVHHLYVCTQGSVALRNHLGLRDYLRAHPAEAAAYSGLKKQLAARFSDDIDGYVDGKTDFILAILDRLGFGDAALQAVAQANRK